MCERVCISDQDVCLREESNLEYAGDHLYKYIPPNLLFLEKNQLNSIF